MDGAVIGERARRAQGDRGARTARRDQAGVEGATVLRGRVRDAVGVVPEDLLADVRARRAG